VQQFFLVKHYPCANDLKMIYEVVRKLSEDGQCTYEAIDKAIDELASSKLKVCLKLLKDGKLLRQNRKLEYAPTATEPRAALFDKLAAVYSQKQERDREALEHMVSYAVSGFCRWKVLLDYFGDEVEGFDKCCRCDNCLNPPQVAELEIDIRDDEFDRGEQAQAAGPRFEPGAAVKVPKFERGTVVSVAGDQVTIAFPDKSTRVFLAEFVVPA